MAAYLRIDGLSPEDLDGADLDLFGDLANAVFDDFRADAPELFEDCEGVIPVRRPGRDPRLLEATAVYAHVVETPGEDIVRCLFGDPCVEGLDVPGSHAQDASTAAVIELTEAVASTGDDRLDDQRWRAFTSGLPVLGAASPIRVGTLYHDDEHVVRIDLDHLDDGDHVVECKRCGARGLPERVSRDNHTCRDFRPGGRGLAERGIEP